MKPSLVHRVDHHRDRVAVACTTLLTVDAELTLHTKIERLDSVRRVYPDIRKQRTHFIVIPTDEAAVTPLLLELTELLEPRLRHCVLVAMATLPHPTEAAEVVIALGFRFLTPVTYEEFATLVGAMQESFAAAFELVTTAHQNAGTVVLYIAAHNIPSFAETYKRLEAIGANACAAHALLNADTLEELVDWLRNYK